MIEELQHYARNIMKKENLVPSTLKVVASEDLNLYTDHIDNEPHKTIAELLNEQEKNDETKAEDDSTKTNEEKETE